MNIQANIRYSHRCLLLMMKLKKMKVIRSSLIVLLQQVMCAWINKTSYAQNARDVHEERILPFYVSWSAFISAVVPWCLGGLMMCWSVLRWTLVTWQEWHFGGTITSSMSWIQNMVLLMWSCRKEKTRRCEFVLVLSKFCPKSNFFKVWIQGWWNFKSFK